MVNVTTLNTTVILPGSTSYVPVEVWGVMVALAVIFFLIALFGSERSRITIAATISAILSVTTAWLSGYIDFHNTTSVINETGDILVIPVSNISSPPWFSWIMIMFFFASIILVVWNAYLEYMTRRPEWKQNRFKY